jgi:hypothetical protein
MRTREIDNKLTPPHERLSAAPEPPIAGNSHAPQAKWPGFAQIFGLHPAIALLTFIVDSMLFAAEAGSLGTFWPVSVGVSLVLGFITWRAQMKWYGDDSESAALKGLIIALLTAIPTNIPAWVYVSAGIVGLFRRKKN